MDYEKLVKEEIELLNSLEKEIQTIENNLPLENKWRIRKEGWLEYPKRKSVFDVKINDEEAPLIKKIANKLLKHMQNYNNIEKEVYAIKDYDIRGAVAHLFFGTFTYHYINKLKDGINLLNTNKDCVVGLCFLKIKVVLEGHKKFAEIAMNNIKGKVVIKNEEIK